MLQIDHIYEFFYINIFFDFENWNLPSGISNTLVPTHDDVNIFMRTFPANKLIFFYDQEPILEHTVQPYIELLKYPNVPLILATSEISNEVNLRISSLPSFKYNLNSLYYFFHGFAALDWYRGYYSLNYNKPVIKKYKKDFITYNRLITEDRSYRIYFISQLAKHNLIDKGLVSFGVSDDGQHWRDELERNNYSKLSNHARQEIWNTLPNIPDRLIIDNEYCSGDSSSRIPYHIDKIENYKNAVNKIEAFWHIVTETVFYYDKLHLTEKIFKPIVSKQPFMLLAAPGNLAYLKSYGFKTFDSVIDESYDNIQDNDDRIDAVVKQLNWYCNLSDSDKLDVMKKLEPIIEYNFHHFYGEFKNIIVNELITNCKNLFTKIDYQHDHVDFDLVKKLLLN